MLFTDIVDSTVRGGGGGRPRSGAGVLDEFDVNVGRLLARHDGVLVKNTGDGILARFPTPAQGVRCAAAMVEAAEQSGLELRAGLHAGEVELRGDDIGGLAVHIASRVSAMAGAGRGAGDRDRARPRRRLGHRVRRPGPSQPQGRARRVAGAGGGAGLSRGAAGHGPPSALAGRPQLVGMRGFEPRTSCSQSRRAAKLRYIPFLPNFRCDGCYACPGRGTRTDSRAESGRVDELGTGAIDLNGARGRRSLPAPTGTAYRCGMTAPGSG